MKGKKKIRIIVGWREEEKVIIKLRIWFKKGLRMNEKKEIIIEGNVGIDIGIKDKEIIGKKIDKRRFWIGEKRVEKIWINRKDKDGIKEMRDKVLEMIEMILLVEVRRMEVEIWKKIIRWRDEIIEVERKEIKEKIVNGKEDKRMLRRWKRRSWKNWKNKERWREKREWKKIKKFNESLIKKKKDLWRLIKEIEKEKK